MYAIVEIAGLQYKVEKDQRLYVNRLKGEKGDSITFDQVLLTDNGTVTVGAPVIDGVAVQAKILDQVKGDKVIVFKKKRRKGYKKKNGHRQQFTQIEIMSIAGDSKSTKKKETKTEEVKPEPEVKSSKKVEKKVDEATPKDDLTKVEGIGPKSAEALVNAGVSTFQMLSEKSAEEVKEILVTASSRLASLDPATWAQQAKLAADGKWDELKVLQDKLDGGKA